MDKLNALAKKILKKKAGRYNSYVKGLIPTHLSKSLTALKSIEEDLTHVKNALLTIIKLYDINPSLKENANLKDDLLTIKASLLHSAIVIYGKCFTDATSTQSTKLDKIHCFQEGDTLLKTHDRIMELRHNYIAHRGESEFEETVALLLIDISVEPDHHWIEIFNNRTVSIPLQEINDFLLVVDHLLIHVDGKYQKRANGVYKAYTSLVAKLSDDDLRLYKID